MAKMDAQDHKKLQADKEVTTCTSGSNCWLHIRILYGVVLCLTLVTGLSLCYCLHEVVRLRRDFEGEIVPRGMVDITEPHGHYGYQSVWDDDDEDDFDEDDNENYTSPDGLVPEQPPLQHGGSRQGYEVLDATTPEEEELIRVKRRAPRARSSKKSKRSKRKRNKDNKDNHPTFFYENGESDNAGENDHGSGNGSPDQTVWLTSYSRIPVFALQEFCAATREYCPPGQAGLQGPPGLPGLPGANGHNGLKGEPGYTGDKGEGGLPGLDGLTGLDGGPGKQGQKGDPGDPGPRGYVGTKGDEGPPGPPGLPGSAGRDGNEGPPGLDGPPGVNGTTGRRGKRGKLGSQGPPGEMGEPGVEGLRGLKGDTGEPGLDADTQNCTCPPGPYATGPPGAVGPKGPQGPKGQKGDVGSSNLVLDTTIATTTTTTPVPTTISTTVEPTIDPRVSGCRIRMVGKPLFQRYTGTYWGAWMKDTFRNTPPDGDKFWFTRHFTGKSLHEYNNQDEFRADKQSTVYTLDDLYFGTGHAVYNGAFFYHKSGTSHLIKYDLAAREVTGEVEMPGAAFQGKDCVYSTEYNYMDIAADGNGLWVLYNAAGGAMHLMVSKVNPDTMIIEKTWNITVAHRHYGNGFITCGVLYLIKNTHAKTTLIDFAYDLYTKTQLSNVRLQFTNPFQMNNMISYNPVDGKIYSWDKGNQLTYPLLL